MKVLAAEDAAGEFWDAVVIGTGMGGATLGYVLAKAGWKVLFCEQGQCSAPSDGFLEGAYAETFLPGCRAPTLDDTEVLRRAGRYAQAIEDCTNAFPRSFIPFIGAGAGGSTALYGMALERFFPQDFRQKSRSSRSSADAPNRAWPIDFDEMVPFYEAAETLYGVRGSVDPLRPPGSAGRFAAPPPLSAHGAELFDHFERVGMHPYRLPLACGWVDGCDVCQGFLCSKSCKNDSSSICLRPAIERHGASLVERCAVTKLRVRAGEIDAVMCRVDDRDHAFRGRFVFLAAGALGSPKILLDSACEGWVNGLANESDQVGRNLMRHLVDLIAVKTSSDPNGANSRKELSFNDFYIVDDQEKLGNVQSFGRLPPADVMFSALLQDLRFGPAPWAAPILKLVRPVVQAKLREFESRCVVLAVTIEDSPRSHNRVVRSRQGRLAFEYRLSQGDRARLDRMRKSIAMPMRGLKYSLIRQAENNQRLAHVCGTCRSGMHAGESVVNTDCRAHGIGNLFVADASVFPTSGGTNPSLTIAANALRVAYRLCGATA